MRKINIVITFMLGVVMCVSAQESNDKVTNKKGISILPAAGDFAIGLEALSSEFALLMSSAKTEPEDKITINDMNMDNINPFLFIILPHLMILNTC